MISLLVRDLGLATMGRQLGREVRKFRRTYKKKLREAGRIVKRKQIQLLKSGRGPRSRRIGRKTKTGKTRRSSLLLTSHKVVIKPAKSGSKEVGSLFGGTDNWELFVGPTPRGKAFYAKFHELGTGERKSKGGASRGSLLARPWMGEAGQAELNKVERVLGSSYRAFASLGVKR